MDKDIAEWIREAETKSERCCSAATHTITIQGRNFNACCGHTSVFTLALAGTPARTCIIRTLSTDFRLQCIYGSRISAYEPPRECPRCKANAFSVAVDRTSRLLYLVCRQCRWDIRITIDEWK